MPRCVPHDTSFTVKVRGVLRGASSSFISVVSYESGGGGGGGSRQVRPSPSP